MANSFSEASLHQDAMQGQTIGEQPVAFDIGTNAVRVAKNQIADERVAVDWFQQQQAQFALRFLNPSFRGG
jgi:hypothetical protein